jgi:aspartate/methionine/tyrosine aminotransferase
MLMNSQLALLTESFTIALADRVRQMKRDGIPVIGLQTGDPDFKTPQPIMDAAYQAMQEGLTHYGNSRGLPALREAIARDIQIKQGITYNPDTEILVTHGAIHAYYVGLQVILNRGDAVLVPDPTWQTHANMVKLLHGQAIRVPALPENDFFPTIEAWRNALTANTHALVINTPCNPTGMVASREYLQQLVDFAVEHDLYIVSDEVYDHLLYEGAKHVSLASLDGAKDRTLLLNSFSKTYAMTGWRIGYLCAPQPVIDNALKASQHSITNIAEFVQRAALVALTNTEAQAAALTMQNAYTRRREMVLALYDRYGATPLNVMPPQGAFYFFLDVRQLGLSANVIAERLLLEQQVAIVPGSAYGDAGEGFLRMTIAAADSDIETGITRILDWVAQLQR